MSSVAVEMQGKARPHDGLHHFWPAVAIQVLSIEIKHHQVAWTRRNEGSSSMLSWGGAVGTATVKADAAKNKSAP